MVLCETVGQARRRGRAGAQSEKQGQRVNEEANDLTPVIVKLDDTLDIKMQMRDNRNFDEQCLFCLTNETERLRQHPRATLCPDERYEHGTPSAAHGSV